jgi:dsRNA-specific ribonuclease
MLLLLLEGTPWCPPDSYLVNGNWKKQKQVLARCLDLLLAAVYRDSGLEAAVGLAAALIHNTPPTTHDKSWMPAWARQK